MNLMRAANLEPWAALAERVLLPQRDEIRAPILLILGQPRSGTTLVYQYLVHRLPVAYFTNGVGRHFRAPCLTTLLQTRLHGPYRSDFKSDYGKVEGPTAPREAGSFWARFFDLNAYAARGDVSPEKARELRRVLARMQVIAGGAPFVNKNIKHMLRLDALASILPEARFLVVERDRRDVALSILRGRLKFSPGEGEWWSVRPPGSEQWSEAPVEEQVARQVMGIERRLNADLAALAPERVLRFGYEMFCESPEALIDYLEPTLGALTRRNEAVPHFERAPNEPRTAGESRLLELLNLVD